MQRLEQANEAHLMVILRESYAPWRGVSHKYVTSLIAWLCQRKATEEM